MPVSNTLPENPPEKSSPTQVNAEQEEVAPTIMVPVVYLVLNVKAPIEKVTTTMTSTMVTSAETTSTTELLEEITMNTTEANLLTTMQTETTETPRTLLRSLIVNMNRMLFYKWHL